MLGKFVPQALAQKRLCTKANSPPGGKAWILLEAPRALRSQRLWNPSDLTLGGSGCGSLHNMAGAKVSNVLACYSTNLQQAFDLTRAFKTFFCYESCKLCSKIAGSLEKQRFGCLVDEGHQGKLSKGHADLNLS